MNSTTDRMAVAPTGTTNGIAIPIRVKNPVSTAGRTSPRMP